MNPTDMTLVGAYGSPYSIKMRAVLRYRRIPYRWVVRNSSQDRGFPDPPVPIIPLATYPVLPRLEAVGWSQLAGEMANWETDLLRVYHGEDWASVYPSPVEIPRFIR